MHLWEGWGVSCVCFEGFFAWGGLLAGLVGEALSAVFGGPFVDEGDHVFGFGV